MLNHFLIYVPGGEAAALEAIGKLGKLRRADANISVLETDAAGVRVETEIALHVPPGTNFFVAKVNTLARDGDAQFLSSLEHLLDTE